MVMKKKKGMHGSQTGFPRLGAADLRTLAKARQNRMWKIEFTKQLSINLHPAQGRAGERGKELKGGREGGRERARDHGGSLRGQNKSSV